MSKRHVRTLWAVLVLVAMPTTGQSASAQVPLPLGPLPEIQSPDKAAAEMGRRLFFDPRVSGDGALSCASCHDPAQGFSKGRNKKGAAQALSDAYPGTKYFRNAPSLINTAFKSRFENTGWGWDGHIGANLNDVVRNEITETTIMNTDMRLLHERMKQDPVYVQMCAQIYGGECSSGKARKAIVEFLKTLISSGTPFDTGSLGPSATRGQALFEGKAGCTACHNGPLLSDGKPHNTGVPENMDIFRDPVRHLTYRSVLSSHGVPNTGAWRRDVGYFLVSKKYEDVGKFVTPPLRELIYTAPYMHNGTLQTLEDVIDFYNAGGGHDDLLPSELKPLQLVLEEKSDLLAFLQSLSSTTPVGASPVGADPVSIPQRYEPTSQWLETAN